MEPNVALETWAEQYGFLLIDKVIELKMQLAAQHRAVDEAASHWRKIGYAVGWTEGYDEACRDLD